MRNKCRPEVRVFDLLYSIIKRAVAMDRQPGQPVAPKARHLDFPQAKDFLWNGTRGNQVQHTSPFAFLIYFVPEEVNGTILHMKYACTQLDQLLGSLQIVLPFRDLARLERPRPLL